MNYPKMNPEWKKKWLEALRSRRFKQGRGQLKIFEENNKVTHCCLGVLTEVVDPNHTALQDGAEFLPEDVCKVVGIDTFMREAGDVQAELSEMNDAIAVGPKPGFARIIKWIEKNL